MPDLSLDSPLVTLGALFMVGQNDRGRQFTGGETGKGLIAGGFGGASAEYLGQQVSDLAGGQLPVSDALGQAMAGAAISRFGDPIPQNNAIARGIHYNVATQMVQETGLGLGDMLGDVTGGTSSSSGSTTSNAPSVSTSGSTNSSAPSAGRTHSMNNSRRSGKKVF
jgi:hypothetical protein